MSKSRTFAALLDRASAVPPAEQTELADTIADAVAELELRVGGVYRLDDDERAGVRRGLDAARRGEFASDEEIAAMFARARAGRA